MKSFAVILCLLSISCAVLNSIPFSVSYQDRGGDVFTVTKLAVPIVRPEK